MCPKLPVSLFDTRDFSKRDQYESFRESVSVVFDVEGAQETSGFSARIKTYLMQEMMLIEAFTNAEQSFKRTAQAIARDNLDHYLIQIFQTGYTVETQSKGDIICGPERIIVIDTSCPWEAFNGAFKNLTLAVPRRVLAPSLIDADAHHGQILDPARNSFARVLYDYIISMQSAIEQMDTHEASSLTRPTLELLSAALNHSQARGLKDDEVEASLNYSMRLRVKQFIEANLSDPKLCVEMIAFNCSLSRSYLYRLFPKSHAGVMSYARKRRMNLALKKLTSSEEFSESVAEVAYSTGFESESGFIKAFKAYHKLTPREARKEFLERPSKVHVGAGKGRIWEQWYREL